jgi:hypothetical protein
LVVLLVEERLASWDGEHLGRDFVWRCSVTRDEEGSLAARLDYELAANAVSRDVADFEAGYRQGRAPELDDADSVEGGIDLVLGR